MICDNPRSCFTCVCFCNGGLQAKSPASNTHRSLLSLALSTEDYLQRTVLGGLASENYHQKASIRGLASEDYVHRRLSSEGQLQCIRFRGLSS
ncbi:hypothetical protein BaRGS_00025861 [Batillaria attramentaria]|uniref:Uncharacterized protein n=1 Tax=Batillaria attramentaria TaxID=370345 RepID=A0ABD0JXL8_9CAEN